MFIVQLLPNRWQGQEAGKHRQRGSLQVSTRGGRPLNCIPVNIGCIQITDGRQGRTMRPSSIDMGRLDIKLYTMTFAINR